MKHFQDIIFKGDFQICITVPLTLARQICV